MKIKLFITILSVVACMIRLAAQSGGQTPEAAFDDGERLTYVVSYRAALVPNIEAGEVIFKTAKTTVDGVAALNVNANAKVFSHFKWFYDLDDTYQTWLDQSTLKPIKFAFQLKEGKYRAVCDYSYDWENKKVTTVFHNLRRPEPETKVMTINDKSMDAIALFYNLRSQDLSSLVPERGNKLELILDDTIRTLTFKYLGKEERKIKKLGTFSTLQFSCTIATSSGESFEDGSEFFLWVTDDKNKMPVYLESPIKIGSVRVTLTKYQGVKHPVAVKK